MSKTVKQLITKELQTKLAGVSEFVVLDIAGVDGLVNNALRGKLGKKGVKLTMVRNAMMRKAAEELNMASAASLFQSGQCTIAYGLESAVDLAKELKAVITADKIKVKFTGAYLDGAALDAKGAENLVNMKSKAQLQGDIVAIANSPAQKLVSAMLSPARVIAGCIKTIADKEEKAAA